VPGVEDLPVVTEPSESYLNQRQLLDYRSEREDCLEWLLTFGKNPDRAEGYAFGTVEPRSYRMDRFYRWVWESEEGYTANVKHEHADAWMRHLAQRDVSATHKTNCLKALKTLFKWRRHEHGLAEWEPAFQFSKEESSQPRDYLTREERNAVRNKSCLPYLS
jgi:site-specific recombinase XerD